MKRISPELCIKCKGYKKLCGLPYCPILRRFQAQLSALLQVDLKRMKAHGSTPPSVVVGEKGYPRVSLMLNMPPGIVGDQARIYEDPKAWWGRYSLGKILELRSQLLSLTIRIDVHNPWELYEREIGVAALSRNPVASEAKLARKPLPILKFDAHIAPQGPLVPVKDLKITENPRIDKLLERVLWDDAKASDSVVYLYNRGVNIYTIQRALSLGFLGRIKTRKLVPTRWAITATDNIISEYLSYKVKSYREISSIKTFYSEYLGNKFLIVLLPGALEIEWFEVWHPNTLWTPKTSNITIYVYHDRITDKKIEDGGYLAAKTSLLEYMEKQRIQAKAIIVREVLPTYYAPVGNWHIRETVRNALNVNPPVNYDDPLIALYSECERRLLINCKDLVRKSIILDKLLHQKTLNEYFEAS